VFILTHGRPDRVYTYNTLKKSGYTGKVYIVIDDEDKTAEEYRKRFGDAVLQFSKEQVAREFDEGDNFNDRRAIFYARNACWKLAEQVGCRYFVQFDDDYYIFGYQCDRNLRYKYFTVRRSMDQLLSAMVDFYEESGALTVAMSQGGDWMGGESSWDGPNLRRKAMNSFVCSNQRPFSFVGRVNEDVNTYTSMSRTGGLFLTVRQVKLDQKQTQSNAGGMTEMYLDSGTYVKSFYSVMYSPSCVKVGVMGDPRSGHVRLHHNIDWPRTAPCILREEHRKGGGRW
jgi:hypothetical protein